MLGRTKAVCHHVGPMLLCGLLTKEFKINDDGHFWSQRLGSEHSFQHKMKEFLCPQRFIYKTQNSISGGKEDGSLVTHSV